MKFFIFLLVLLVLLAFLEVDARAHLATCSASGDPHYRTFDGRRYNFMGVCRYVHVTDNCKVDCGKPRLGTFKVIVENVKCGRSVSCIKSVEVVIRGAKITLRRNTFAPANKNARYYSVRREGRFVVVRTKPAGLTVKWNRKMGLHIYLSSQYKGKVCGLCGNYNGNMNDDYIKSNGDSAGNNVNAFTQSWQAGGKCGPAPVAPKHPCNKNPKRRRVAVKDCAVILSSHFKCCKDGGVDVNPLYRNCLYDVCAETKSSIEESSCEAIKEASLECKEQTGKSVTWGHLEQKCRQ